MLIFLKGGNSKQAWKATTQNFLIETLKILTFNRLKLRAGTPFALKEKR